MKDFQYVFLFGAISDQLWAERGKNALHAADLLPQYIKNTQGHSFQQPMNSRMMLTPLELWEEGLINNSVFS